MPVVLTRPSHRICSILINRPAKRNAINLECFQALQRCLKEFEEDDDLHVAILGGVGGNFCAGYDVNEIVAADSGRPNMDRLKQMLLPTHSHRLSDKKMIVAAIDGHAAGFGYELALRCDFRVAERDARMGFMNRRLGIPILNGGTVILPQLVGFARASELIATGKAQPAPEALESGVIAYIADVGCAMGRATNLARCLAKFIQPALVHDLKSMNRSMSAVTRDLLVKEQQGSLEYLRQCGSLELATRFIKGELFRHGTSDMGNVLKPEPEVTL